MFRPFLSPLIALLFFIPGCHHHTAEPGGSPQNRPQRIREHVTQWSEYISANDLHALIGSTVSTFERARIDRDTALATHAGIHASQAYLFAGKLDSAIWYLDRTNRPTLEKDPLLEIIAHNIAAVYAMKVELNYTQALEHFTAAYDLSVSQNDDMNRLVQLCNIATIYYEREDSTGLRYAQEACELARNVKNPYLTVNVTLTTGQMLTLAKRWREARAYADSAARIVRWHRLSGFEPVVRTLQADICRKTGDPAAAELHYREACKLADDADTDSRIKLLLDYAGFLCERTEYSRGTALYEEALHLSYQSNNNLHRRDILSGLSNALFAADRKEEALRFYNLYHRHLDSVSVWQKEREFQRQRLARERDEHLRELESKRIQLAKSRGAALATVLIALIVVLASVAAYLLVRRKNRMYRQIVLQYQRDRHDKKTPAAAESEGPEADDRLLQIYKGIERLMTADRIYRDKELSLETMAARMNTNKSYISKAINKYACNSFYNYVNQFRVEEATEILSAPGPDVSLKQLAADLGFNSTSTFYRAFQKEICCPPHRFRQQMRHINRLREKETRRPDVPTA